MQNKNLNNALFPLALSGFALIDASGAVKQLEKPNIIFILADDFGWADWEGGGSTFYETPNLLRLAKEGIQFTQAYAQPLCSPTRASLLSGKYAGAKLHMHQAITGNSVTNPKVPATAGVNSKMCWPESSSELPLSEVTIAEELKKLGYTTIEIGKWHLGNKNYYPEKQGFDVSRAIGGAGPGSGGYIAPFTLDNFPEYSTGDYLPDKMTDVAMEYVEQYKNQPFFMYLPHYSVHSPYQAKPELIKKYTNKAANDPGNRQKHPVMGAMIQSLDENVGRLLDKVKEAGIEDKTIVIFMGDNGGVHWNNDNAYSSIPVTSNYPLRAGKCCFYEGGVRVPLLIKCPGLIPADVKENTPVHVVDFYPTLIKYAGGTTMKADADGVDIRSLIEQKGTISERPIFCHFPRTSQIGADVGGTSVRKGDYKLYMFYGDNADRSNRFELYNINNDIGESKDLASQMPQKVDELKILINNFLQTSGALIPIPNPNYKGGGTVVNDAPTNLVANVLGDSAVITWQIEVENALSYKIERSSSPESGWTKVGDVDLEEDLVFTDYNLDVFSPYYYRVTAVYSDKDPATSDYIMIRTPSKTKIALTAPWKYIQFGAPAISGFVEEHSGKFSFDAGEGDLWNSADKAMYVYQEAEGDMEMFAKVESLEGVQAYSMSGIMVRESLDADAKAVSMLIINDPGTMMRERVETSGLTNQKPIANNKFDPPYWVRIVRKGNVFSGYHSPNGTTWTLERSVTLPMTKTIYAGLTVNSHFALAACKSVLSDVFLKSEKVSSVNDLHSLNFSIFPNPAIQIVNLIVPAVNFDCEILTLDGKLLSKEKNNSVLNICGLANGLYILKITTKQSTGIQKLVIEK